MLSNCDITNWFMDNHSEAVSLALGPLSSCFFILFGFWSKKWAYLNKRRVAWLLNIPCLNENKILQKSWVTEEYLLEIKLRN